MIAYFLLGSTSLLIVLLLFNRLIKTPPAQLIQGLRYGGAIALFATAILMAFGQRYSIAISLAGLGFIMIGVNIPLAFGPLGLLYPLFQRLSDTLKTKAHGHRAATSKISTRFLAMTLDHDSGGIAGMIIAGPYRDRSLGSCTHDELLVLRDQWRRDDPDSARLLDVYLSRHHGDPAVDDPHAAMDRSEALRVLGLAQDASEAAIKQAHRNLISKLHPDRGGSQTMAARLNQARDILLGRA